MEMPASTPNGQAATPTPPPTGDSIDKPPVTSHHNNRLLVAIVALSLLFIIGAAVWMLLKPQETTKDTADTAAHPPSFARQYNQNCDAKEVQLTSSPIPIAQLAYIEPLGKVFDGHVTPTDHQYFAPKTTQGNSTSDVMMPADGVVVEVGAMPSTYVGDLQQQAAPEDYRLVISHSCVYYSIFIHVRHLHDPLASAVGQIKPNTSKQVRVRLKAGDLLGKVNGNPVDWTYINSTRTLSNFTTPLLYASEPWKVHTIDPIHLYTGELKAALENLSLRSAVPIGGKIDYDQKDALIGNWFREGTDGYAGSGQERYWDGHLSIAPDYIDAVSPVVSIGSWTGGKAQQFAVKGDFDPAKVLKGQGLIKVELIPLGHQLPSGEAWTGKETATKGITVSKEGETQGTILFEVLEGNKLKVEKFPGKTAAQVSGFTSAAQTYYR